MLACSTSHCQASIYQLRWLKCPQPAQTAEWCVHFLQIPFFETSKLLPKGFKGQYRSIVQIKQLRPREDMTCPPLQLCPPAGCCRGCIKLRLLPRGGTLPQAAPSQVWVIGALKLTLFPKERARERGQPPSPGAPGTIVPPPPALPSDICVALCVQLAEPGLPWHIGTPLLGPPGRAPDHKSLTKF